MNYGQKYPANEHQPTNTQNEPDERTRSFGNSMVVMWQAMGKLFHPQWTKNYGEVGGPIFRDWAMELERYGSQGVLRGLQAIRNSGTAYLPNLNKFAGGCGESGDDGRPGESYSEQVHGGKLKPSPNGIPLCWTIGAYTDEELRASPCEEDRAVAAQSGGNGWTHQSLLEQAR